jgi:hypothetical protein
MNQKIRELAEQAGFQSIVRGDHIVFDISTKENLKEFAELIVRECADMVESSSLPDAYSESCLAVIAEEIKEHFGVEE